MVGDGDHASATAAILSADRLAPHGQIFVKGMLVMSGGLTMGRQAAVRKGGWWRGPDVAVGLGYLVDPSSDQSTRKKATTRRRGRP